MFKYPKIVFLFEKCSGFGRFYKNVPISKNCLHFLNEFSQILFTISKSVAVSYNLHVFFSKYRFPKMFALPNLFGIFQNCSPFQNMFSRNKKCSSFQICSWFFKIVLHFKICSEDSKNVCASKNSPRFQIFLKIQKSFMLQKIVFKYQKCSSFQKMFGKF